VNIRELLISDAIRGITPCFSEFCERKRDMYDLNLSNSCYSKIMQQYYLNC